MTMTNTYRYVRKNNFSKTCCYVLAREGLSGTAVYFRVFYALNTIAQKFCEKKFSIKIGKNNLTASGPEPVTFYGLTKFSIWAQHTFTAPRN